MKLRWKILIPALAVGVTVGGITAATARSASGAAPPGPNNPPPVPRIVNADGSLNLPAVEAIPLLNPTTGTLSKPTVAQITGAGANLTPAQFNAMTPAQRTANGAATAP